MSSVVLRPGCPRAAWKSLGVMRPNMPSGERVVVVADGTAATVAFWEAVGVGSSSETGEFRMVVASIEAHGSESIEAWPLPLNARLTLHRPRWLSLDLEPSESREMRYTERSGAMP